MKTIGVIGGLSWQSTQIYYQLINQQVEQRLGQPHSAKVLINSLDFAPIAKAIQNKDLDSVADLLVGSARQLEAGGAELICLANNSLHSLFPLVAESISVEPIFITRAIGDELHRLNLSKVALLGTSTTMESDWFTQQLIAHGDHSILVPSKPDRARLDKLIFSELCAGQLSNQTIDWVNQLLAGLSQQGTEAVVLACTELSLLIPHLETELSIIDSTKLHCQLLINKSLRED